MTNPLPLTERNLSLFNRLLPKIPNPGYTCSSEQYSEVSHETFALYVDDKKQTKNGVLIGFNRYGNVKLVVSGYKLRMERVPGQFAYQYDFDEFRQELRNHAATYTIQCAYRQAFSDPSFWMCKKRLWDEFAELTGDTRGQ